MIHAVLMVGGFSVGTFFAGAGGQWLLSAFIGGMPPPTTASGMGYNWLYGSLHLLAANLDKVGPQYKQEPK